MLAGDALTMLQSLPDGCVQCAITSPPYYSLRDNKCEGQIGLEATPELYIERLVAVFREMKRVLRQDATFWLNMGDGYTSGGRTWRAPLAKSGQAVMLDRPATPVGLKDKDLIMMPHRLALALQADGWWVRMDCVWAKGNPMPESCRDRPTRSHEYVFLLTKAAKYYYDPVAVREPCVSKAAVIPWHEREYDQSFLARQQANGKKGRPKGVAGFSPGGGRNQRSVWTISARAYAGAHFSTFPPALVEPCLKAGTSARGCCPQCGAPWKRVIETTRERSDRPARGKALTSPRQDGNSWNENAGRGFFPPLLTEHGWTPTCAHDDPPVPCICLDPFAGSGTVGAVALAHGRHAVLIELQEAYLPLIQARLAAVQTRMEGVE